MVRVKQDLTGKRYGMLEVLYQAEDYIAPNGWRAAQWVCKCDCGNDNYIVRGDLLRYQQIDSCGCCKSDKIARSNKKYNKYDLSGEYGIGWTTNTNQKFYFDLDAYDKIKGYCWFEHMTMPNFSTLSAFDPATGRTVYMHILLGYKYHDHIDHNELNNLRANLRPATQAENAKNRKLSINNTSGVTGVCWHKRKQLWQARIYVDKQRKTLGYFENKEDAIRARLKAEIKYYGEFAPQKYLYEQYGITTTN